MFFLTSSFADGRQTLKKFNEYVAGALERMGESRDAARYREGYEQLERELNLDLSEMASLVTELGVIRRKEETGYRYRASAPCFFAKVSDSQRAARMMQQMGKGHRDRRDGSYQFSGETINLVANDFVWCLAQGHLIFGGKRSVESALTAKKKTGAESESSSWAKVRALSPKTSGILAFVDFTKLDLRSLGGGSPFKFAGIANLVADKELIRISITTDVDTNLKTLFKEISETTKDITRFRRR
jgi:hypothetical protein